MQLAFMFQVFDVIFAVAAIVGAVLCVLWVYNSTNKERTRFIRRTKAFRNRGLIEELERGARYQRIAFASAFVGTGVVILVFEYFYWREYGVGIAAGYNYAAAALIFLGAVALLVAFIRRNR
jgi:uncharacterized membrane protein YedE/YeeE